LKLHLRLLIFVCFIAGFQFPATAESCKTIVSPLTFEKIERTLRECEITRIEELLPLLPPDFRSRFVFVYSSQSLQGASPTFPRVIMFGLDAKFILTFSGSPELHGYDSLETIEFTDHSKKFQFRSISFPSEIQSSDKKKPQISELNPERCTFCHRKELRPNWDTYSSWPGVFGSKDDGMPAAEKKSYLEFKDNIYLKAGRYRYFEDATKYPDGARFYDYFPSGRTNLQFTFLLSLLNGQSIAREISRTPQLHPFRYALLASLRCDDDYNDPQVLAQLIPESITSTFSKSYQEISTEVTNGIETSYKTREQRQFAILSNIDSSLPIKDWEHRFDRQELCCASNTSRLRYIMEVAGVPFPKWSLEFGSQNYVFFAGEVGEVGELGLFLWNELLDPVLDAELYQIYLSAWDKRTDRGVMVFSENSDSLCNELKKKSLAALSAHSK
jgi:hypothetical protein